MLGYFIFVKKSMLNISRKQQKLTSNSFARKVFDPLFTKSGGGKLLYIGFVERLIICVKLLLSLTHKQQNTLKPDREKSFC